MPAPMVPVFRGADAVPSTNEGAAVMNDPTKRNPDPSGDLQGEGNYDAARRHRESVEDFVRDNDVEQAARDAEPQGRDEERALEDAEAEGRSHARK
jgi:hypothetical protein